MKYKKTGNQDKDADNINSIINEAIKAFVAEDFKLGVEALIELAELYKAAGTTAQTFSELAQFVENEAIERSGNQLLQTQIRSALHDRKKNRPILMVVK